MAIKLSSMDGTLPYHVDRTISRKSLNHSVLGSEVLLEGSDHSYLLHPSMHCWLLVETVSWARWPCGSKDIALVTSGMGHCVHGKGQVQRRTEITHRKN